MNNRYLFGFFLLLLVHCARAQNNYCDDLMADTDKVKGIVSVKSPDASIILKRVQADGKEELWINFNIRQRVEFVPEEGGLFVRLEGGKLLRYFGQPVRHTFLSARDGYFFTSDLLLKPEELELLRTKKITKFQIASIDVPVTDELAIAIEAYVGCLSAVKP